MTQWHGFSPAVFSDGHKSVMDANECRAFDEWLRREQPAGCVADMFRGWAAKAELLQVQCIAIGWMRADGSLHKGCPPLEEPEGWCPLMIDKFKMDVT